MYSHSDYCLVTIGWERVKETTTEEDDEIVLSEDVKTGLDIDALCAFSGYLEHRQTEICRGLDNMETWDPYLVGLTRGMQMGLEIAQDCIASWIEWISP
jgi:hypothetical protein